MKRIRQQFGNVPLTPAMKQWRLDEIETIRDPNKRDETKQGFLRAWALARAEGRQRSESHVG